VFLSPSETLVAARHKGVLEEEVDSLDEVLKKRVKKEIFFCLSQFNQQLNQFYLTLKCRCFVMVLWDAIRIETILKN
jgi:hypothetical protein